MKLSVCLIKRNTTKMYMGEGGVVPRIHIEKSGYGVNTCEVFRKSQVQLPARTPNLLIHFAVFVVAPCKCSVLSTTTTFLFLFPSLSFSNSRLRIIIY